MLYRRALLDLAYTVAGVTLFYITKGGKTHKLRPIRMAGRISKAIAQKFWAPDFLRSTFLSTRVLLQHSDLIPWCRLLADRIISFPVLPPSLSLSSEGKLRVWRRAQGWSRLSWRANDSEGREKMGSYIQVQEQYRTTGFFFLLILSKKKETFSWR